MLSQQHWTHQIIEITKKAKGSKHNERVSALSFFIQKTKEELKMLAVTKMPISFNYSKLSNRQIKYIVIHDTGNIGKGANVDSHFKFFNGGNRSASADFFVDDKKIGMFNPDLGNCYMWAVGDGAGKYGITNRNSISVELCINSDGNFEKTFTNAVELVQFLMKAYGIDINHVVRHYDASRKMCPNSMSTNNWAKWNEFKRRLVNKVVKEEKKVKYLVIYNNYVDKRNAERLAEHLQCPVLDGLQVAKFDYSCVENPVGVGGGSFNPAVKTVIKGSDRDDTTVAVLKYMKKIK